MFEVFRISRFLNGLGHEREGRLALLGWLCAEFCVHADAHGCDLGVDRLYPIWVCLVTGTLMGVFVRSLVHRVARSDGVVFRVSREGP